MLLIIDIIITIIIKDILIIIEDLTTKEDLIEVDIIIIIYIRILYVR